MTVRWQGRHPEPALADPHKECPMRILIIVLVVLAIIALVLVITGRRKV